MRHLTCALALGFGLISAGAYADEPVQESSYMIRPDGLKKLTSHVYVIPDIVPDPASPQLPNVGFVVGTKGVLAIETGMGPANGALVYAAAKKLAHGKQIYLVTTHIHPEHDLGAQAFSGDTQMIRSRDQVKEIADQGDATIKRFRARNAALDHLLGGAVYRPANIAFDQDYVLDLGGVTARMIALGNNHTMGDTAIWIDEDKLLFSGDTAMKAQPATSFSGRPTVKHWEETLALEEALNPAIIVPSHGPVGDVGFIHGYRAYLDEIRDRAVTAIKAGLDLKSTTDQMVAAMKDRYPDTGRLSNATKMAYDEATIDALVSTHAGPDSLFQPGKGDGKTFNIYHLYSKPDGTTVVEEAPVALVDRPSDKVGDQKILFAGPLNNFSVRWSPNGMTFDGPPNHEKAAHLQLVLQGTFVFEVSNGKKVRAEPGDFTLQTDIDGFGHHLSCEEPKKGLGCIQMNMDPTDAAAFFANMKN